MIYLLQLVKTWSKKERELFVALFDDLSFEIEELGYSHIEDQMELVNEMLYNHLNIEFECDKQLKMFTELIIRKQGDLEGTVRGACLYGGMNVA